jgi:hypothetical protein
MPAYEENYVDPSVEDNDAFEAIKPRKHRVLDRSRNAKATILDGLTVGPRSMGYLYHSGQVADTEVIEIGEWTLYFDGGTPYAGSDDKVIDVNVTGNASVADDLADILAAVYAVEGRDFDLVELPSSNGLAIWWIGEPDNTLTLDASGTANVTEGTATLVEGLERKGLMWAKAYEVTAQDVLTLAVTESVPLMVVPYQGADLKILFLEYLVAGVPTAWPAGVTVTLEHPDLDPGAGTDEKYWVVWLADTAAALSAGEVMSVVVIGE